MIMAQTTPETYGRHAVHYDRRTDAFQHWRDLLVAELPVPRGDTVIDVGCGTGLCHTLLQQKLGPTGTIIGIDTSEQMLRVAADRIAQHNWTNVHLVTAPVATAPIDRIADAALFSAVHDVMQSPDALRNIVHHLRPGAPVAALGGKRPNLWMWPMREWVVQLHEPYISDFTGFDKPWKLLAQYLPDLRVRELAFGAGYLAVGHTPLTTA
jgi:ubiquinone/menaquinone biosynthesis C-methylase UbiE